MRQLLWRWAPMFCDHLPGCAIKDGTSLCDCGWTGEERELFDAAMGFTNVEFQECINCRAKVGAPTLCADCLKRRKTFYEVQNKPT